MYSVIKQKFNETDVMKLTNTLIYNSENIFGKVRILGIYDLYL